MGVERTGSPSVSMRLGDDDTAGKKQAKQFNETLNQANADNDLQEADDDDASSPKTTPQPKAIGGWPTTQSLDTGPKFTDEQIYGETDAASKRIDEQIAKDRAISKKPDQGDFWDDVKAGVVGAVKGIAEPALVVMDFGQMGAALVTHAITDDPDDLDVHFLSATGKRIAASDDPWATGARAGLVLATAIPTGGGSVLVDNVATAIATGDPDQARHILVQGAVGQITATGIAVGVSSATGNGLTGRGTSADDAALIQRIVDARVSEGATETGRGNPSGRTFGTGRTGQGDLTPIRQSPPGGGDPHADPQVLADVGSRGGRTIALDQAPCPTCLPKLAPPKGQPNMYRSSLDGSLRVITPERADSPGSSPKAATIRAARAQQSGQPAIKLSPKLQFVVPYAPPITPFQPLPSAPSRSSNGPIDLGTGGLFLNPGSSTYVPDEKLVPAPTIGVGVRI